MSTEDKHEAIWHQLIERIGDLVDERERPRILQERQQFAEAWRHPKPPPIPSRWKAMRATGCIHTPHTLSCPRCGRSFCEACSEGGCPMCHQRDVTFLKLSL